MLPSPSITPFTPPIIAIFILFVILLAMLKGPLLFKGALTRREGFVPMLMMVIAVGLIKVMGLIFLAEVIYMVIYMVMR